MGVIEEMERPLRWYGVRMVFRALQREENVFEERVTIWKAASFAEAIEQAEVEAADYADPEVGIWEYTGLAQAFETYIPDRAPEPGDEVFSLLRTSELDTEEYLDRFFDTGGERQQRWGSEAD